MDENGVDLGPLARSPDFVAAFDCRDPVLAPIEPFHDRTGAIMHRAQAVHTAWRAAQRVPGVRTAVWRGAGRTNLASDHGPILVEGTAKLNLGVARVALRDLTAIRGKGDGRVVLPTFRDPVRQALWALLARADRAAMPRRLRLRADGDEVVVDLHDGVLRVADAQNGTANLLAFAARAAGAIECSLAPWDETEQPGDPIRATDLLNGGPEGVWRFDSDGWPLSCPADATFTTLANAIALVRACGPIWGEGIEGDCLLLDAAGGRLAHIWMTTDGRSGLGSGAFPQATAH